MHCVYCSHRHNSVDVYFRSVAELLWLYMLWASQHHGCIVHVAWTFKVPELTSAERLGCPVNGPIALSHKIMRTHVSVRNG